MIRYLRGPVPARRIAQVMRQLATEHPLHYGPFELLGDRVDLELRPLMLCPTHKVSDTLPRTSVTEPL